MQWAVSGRSATGRTRDWGSEGARRGRVRWNETGWSCAAGVYFMEAINYGEELKRRGEECGTMPGTTTKGNIWFGLAVSDP